jgi:hypothetical protein
LCGAHVSFQEQSGRQHIGHLRARVSISGDRRIGNLIQFIAD